MAAIESVFTATATEAMCDDSQMSPASTEEGVQVHVTLVFNGVDFDPSDLYDMLNTQYATVTTDKFIGNGYDYIFNISA